MMARQVTDEQTGSPSRFVSVTERIVVAYENCHVSRSLPGEKYESLPGSRQRLGNNADGHDGNS